MTLLSRVEGMIFVFPYRDHLCTGYYRPGNGSNQALLPPRPASECKLLDHWPLDNGGDMLIDTECPAVCTARIITDWMRGFTEF